MLQPLKPRLIKSCIRSWSCSCPRSWIWHGGPAAPRRAETRAGTRYQLPSCGPPGRLKLGWRWTIRENYSFKPSTTPPYLAVEAISIYCEECARREALWVVQNIGLICTQARYVLNAHEDIYVTFVSQWCTPMVHFLVANMCLYVI